MTQGLDCATPLTAKSAALFAADGYVFAARYLVPTGWKMLTRSEAEFITAAGMQIVSVFETTANRPLSGAAAGKFDGATALDLAYKIGQPEGSTIYAAVDFEPTAAQMPLVIAYIKAFAEATPGYNTGVYGCYAVIKAAQLSGACSRFWQTYAWSRGNVADNINIYQYQNDVEVNEIGIDKNASFGNEGWWNTNEPEEVEEYMMNPDDADKVIGLLQEAFKQGVTKITLPDETVITVDDDEIHRLANVQRIASGQPEE